MKLAIATAMALALAGFFAACGGGDDDDTNTGDLTTERVIERVLEAIREPGMVYHAEGDDESMVWLDGERSLFRRRESAAQGARTSVGTGWLRYSYDSNANEVKAEDITPQADLQPRIADPIAHWFEPLNILSFGAQLKVIGTTMADGKEVIAVESTTPITSDGEATGRALVSRVELAADTYLPYAFERNVVFPPGQTPGPDGGTERVRVVMTTSELVAADTLEEGFFAEAVVAEQLKSLAKSIETVRSFGLTPWWLGEEYASDRGFLGLPDVTAFETAPVEARAAVRYALVLPLPDGEAVSRPDAVIVRLAATLEDLVPPTFPEFAGELPESDEQVVVRGQPATLYTSLLTPGSLGCDTEVCPSSDSPLYRRVAFTIGETAVQVEVAPRLAADGTDLNGYNSVEAAIALAEALVEAIATEAEE